MREMLEDLRLDLGIPDSDDEDGLGLKSTLDFSVDPEQTHARRKARTGKHHPAPPMTSQKLPNLRHSGPPKRSASPDAKPPLPRPGSRGSTRTSLYGSNEFRASVEEPSVTEDLTGTGTGSSTFGMVTALQTGEQTITQTAPQTADILKINYAEDDKPGVDETDGPAEEQTLKDPKENGNSEEVIHAADDEEKTELKGADPEEEKIPTDDEYEMPPKTKMVDDMTLSYQYALEDTLDNDGVSDSADDEEDEVAQAMAEASNMQTLAPIMEVDTPKTPKEKSPQLSRPTPKRRTSLTPRTEKDTPRSQARTNTTSESIDISELDEDEQDDF